MGFREPWISPSDEAKWEPRPPVGAAKRRFGVSKLGSKSEEKPKDEPLPGFFGAEERRPGPWVSSESPPFNTVKPPVGRFPKLYLVPEFWLREGLILKPGLVDCDWNTVWSTIFVSSSFNEPKILLKSCGLATVYGTTTVTTKSTTWKQNWIS